MIARQGLRDWPTRPINSRTPCEPYCASCMPSTIKSKLFGSTASGVLAESLPGSPLEEISSSPSLPLMGKRTTLPSRLIRSAVDFVQTSDTSCPAINNLVLNNEPYEAPRISTLDFMLDRTLLA